VKKVLIGILVGGLGVAAWNRWQAPPAAAADYAVEAPEPEPEPEPEAVGAASQAPKFSCDGRVYCSQMTSCEEARYFLANCPGVKMDGEGDGVPCERQWCGSH
jgi:hypothetical protein